MPRPAELGALPDPLCRSLAWLFADIDDTITADGMLPSASYQAIWDLAGAGIRVVPVTGRPAGWCDHIARMWPVAAVVGENGAFSYEYDRARRRMLRRYHPDLDLSPEGRARLNAISQRVLREVPGSAIAADQPFRMSDVAIDFCEDVPALPDSAVDRICRILAEEGVHYKVSSIHVNYWLGGFDKLSGVRQLLQDRGGFEKAAPNAIFMGDSPNDEPLFAGFPHSVAVGNLRRFLPRIRSLPEFITAADSAAGFVEAVGAILRKRGG